MDVSDGRSLYEVLGVEQDASQVEVKKAYHRLAMQLHPDKNPGDQVPPEPTATQAHARFQTLQRVYTVLGDANRRKVYDRTGSLTDTEELSGDAFDDLYSYYRTVFPKVTEEDIDKVEADYRCSEEEMRDLLRYYTKFGGNMQQVFAWQICCEPASDSHRFMDAIDAAIEKGHVSRYTAYSMWSKATAKQPRPKNPLTRKKKRKQTDGESALVAQIRSRSARHDSLITSLEAKYGAGKSSKGKAAKDKQPTEADFAAAANRLGSGRRGSKLTDKRAQ